jgi:hypothetical protein
VRARRLRLWRSDDTGASLVFALVFITVISFVVVAVLSLADASMRATIKLRGQAAEVAAAEGAANIAINALRGSTYTGGGGCFGGTSDLSVPSSQLPGPGTMSALVSCTPDSTMAQFPLGAPAQAILATATDLLPSITVNDSLNGPLPPTTGLRVSGNIYSNAGLAVSAHLVAEGGGVVRARAGCAVLPIVASITPNPSSAQCNVGPQFPCPECATPSALAGLTGQTPQTVQPCTPIITFTPGRYTDLAALNDRTSGSCNPNPNPIFHFLPGTYYFDFAPTTISAPPPLIATLTIPSKWVINKGSLIGGALARDILPNTQPLMPDSCKSPVPTGTSGWVPHANEGVQFIFSGYSQVEISGNARAEICGLYAGAAAPIAIYAMPTTLLSAPPGVMTCDLALVLPCIALQTGSNFATASPPLTVHIRGAVVGNNRDVNLRVESDTGSPGRPQRYNGGVIARRVVIWTSRPTTAGTPPVFTVHAPIAAAQRQTVAQLDIRLCSGQPTCTSGAVKLKARVQITDPSGMPVAGTRQLTVLSWSVQR